MTNDKGILMRAMLTLLLAVTCAGAWGEEVTADEALLRAQTFASSRLGSKSGTPDVKSLGQVSGLYVFTMGEKGGFVIVSNEDRTIPILGYSDDGTFDPDDLPDNMRAWLQGYADEIAWLQAQDMPDDQSSESRRTERTGSTKTAIAPLIQTNWNQSIPYNILCPKIDDTRTVTGCVATTLAQLMYYYKWPVSACAPLPGYSYTAKNKDKETFKMTVEGLDATTFDWENMLLNYTPVNPSTGGMYLVGTDEQKQAVATLMKYCGTALHMQYGLSANGGSSAYGEAIPYALKTCFGYDGGIRHCYRKNYAYDEWVDLIYSELMASRPVALGGQSAGGGHSFICDGYDTNDHENGAIGDYFHINWGWAGSSDGYFSLSVLQPWEQGIGGSSTLDGFSYGQDAVIGIQPPDDDNTEYCLSLEGLHLGSPDGSSSSKTFIRDGETGAFSGISLYYVAYCYNYGSSAYDASIQLLDENGQVVDTLATDKNKTLDWNKTINMTHNGLTIPSTVGEGTYYIKVMSRPHGTMKWQECFDGDAYKLTAVISSDVLTISVPIPANVLPSATLTVADDMLTGQEQTVTATITGGTGSYNDDVVLRVNGTAVMGKIINVAPGETVVTDFSFIPKQSGTNTLALYTSRTGGSMIGTATNVVITPSALELINDGSNTTAIANHNGIAVNATLSGRTLYKDGDWNTLCLPFDVTDGDDTDDETFSGTPLAGADVRALTTDEVNGTTTGFEPATGLLTLNFTDKDAITEIKAGTPYIIRWKRADGYVNDDTHNIVSPTFDNVTINKSYQDFDSNGVKFLGYYNWQQFDEENEYILFLGSNNRLYYPQPSEDPTTHAMHNPSMGAFRACFQIVSDSKVRQCILNIDDETTGLDDLTISPFDDSNSNSQILNSQIVQWYDLQGRRIERSTFRSASPLGSSKNVQRSTFNVQRSTLKKGIYIHAGRKVVVN